MLGLSSSVPKFVKEFATLGAQIAGAAEAYAREVRARSFPSAANTYELAKPARKTSRASVKRPKSKSANLTKSNKE